EPVRWCSIQVNKVNRRLGACWVRYAISHPGADECEMRIAITRFDDLLRVRQLRSKIDLIMPVFGTFRKQPAESMKELRQQVVAMVHPQSQTSIEITGCRVKRTE